MSDYRSRFPGYTGPINTDIQDGEAGISIFGYIPSLAFAVVAAVTFAILTIAHGWHMRTKATRTFHFLLLFGSVSSSDGDDESSMWSADPYVFISISY